jgi:HK97 family phage major capsid protein
MTDMTNHEKEFHLGEVKKFTARAQEILDRADAEHRDVTDDEDTEYKSFMGRVKESRVRIEQIEGNEARREQLKALGTVPEVASTETVEVKARSVGEAFTKSADYQRVLELAKAEGMPKFELPTIEMKAAGDPVLESTGDNATAIAPTWFGLEAPSLVQYPLRVQDVMNIVQLSTGNSANYPIVTTRSITDMTSTAESENKAGAEFAFDFVTKTVEKWTAFGGASEEMFQDAPTLTNYINTELGVMALQKEERAIIQALYTAATTTVDGSTLQATPTGYDVILAAMTSIRVAGGTPNVVLLNPTDWAVLASTRAVAGTGDYFSGGPYQAPNQGLWGGVREVQTPNVPAGTALVGDFGRGARLFRKGGLRVDSTNSHDDWFRKNLVAIRGEVRSITGVTYPEFFVEAYFGS